MIHHPSVYMRGRERESWWYAEYFLVELNCGVSSSARDESLGVSSVWSVGWRCNLCPGAEGIKEGPQFIVEVVKALEDPDTYYKRPANQSALDVWDGLKGRRCGAM